MEPVACPVCGDTESDKFSFDSDWCRECSLAMMLEQAADAASDAKVTHEVIG